jgi:beta-lactamase regulating signal transducer with metallopeptidase domain
MEFLLGMLKWSAVVGAAALILTLLKPLLDRRYSAKWRYGAWLAMAAFLLLAPARWESLLPRASAEPPVVIEVPRVEVSFSPQEGVSFQRPASPALPSRPGGAEAPARAKAFPLEKLLLAVWLDGMALFFGWYLVGTWRLIRRAKRWSLPPEASTAAFYESLWREMGLKKAPPLRFSRAVDSPMAAGLFRPCLLLPGEPVEARELAFILRHELTHYRRRDLWYKLLLLAANGMHWFNPLAWLLRREAERDLELTCDDAVVAGRDDEERRAYSEALLSSIHRQKGLSRAALSTHFYGGKEVMMERFRNILGSRGRKWGGLVLAIALLATVAAACALGVKPSEDGELAPEELAAWQEKVETMDRYIYRMYSDASYLPPEEILDELSTPGMAGLGHEDIDPKVVSGTRSGDTVTLEIEGNFASRLPSGTLTLVDGEPVSFTTPLYTAVETAARERMEGDAEAYIAQAKEYGSKDLEFTEKYVNNLFCSESMTFDGKTYYIWELYYVMKPNDIDNVFFAGGMEERNGWVTQQQSPGSPILIFSVDGDGEIVLEEQAWSSTTGETGYTWEEYVYCTLHLGMGQGGVLNGWPELNTPFLESLRDGHDTWALDWQDAAISYLNEMYGVYADGGMDSLRTFQADERDNSHDEAVLAQAMCGDRTVTLLLAHVAYPVEVWNATMRFWQVVGEKWEPDAPDTVQGPETPEAPDAAPEGALTEDELAAFTSYFNVVSHNSLLRVPYESFDDLRHYQEILLYDLGKPVTDEAERAALEERMNSPIETDCLKLTREEIRTFYHNNFLWYISEEEMDRMLAEDLSLPNLPEYDAFYFVHGDTMMTQYAFDRGERSEDGTLVNLYYTTDLWQYSDEGELDILWDQPMCVSLWKIGDDDWRVVSNQPAD